MLEVNASNKARNEASDISGEGESGESLAFSSCRCQAFHAQELLEVIAAQKAWAIPYLQCLLDICSCDHIK